jgi:hypothetical protein
MSDRAAVALDVDSIDGIGRHGLQRCEHHLKSIAFSSRVFWYITKDKEIHILEESSRAPFLPLLNARLMHRQSQRMTSSCMTKYLGAVNLPKLNNFCIGSKSLAERQEAANGPKLKWFGLIRGKNYVAHS